MDTNNIQKEQTEKIRQQAEQSLKRLMDVERHNIHQRLKSLSKDAFMDEWMNVITLLFGIKNIDHTLQELMRLQGITKEDLRYGAAVRTTYQTYTIRAIAYFQELLAIDKENQRDSSLTKQIRCETK